MNHLSHLSYFPIHAESIATRRKVNIVLMANVTSSVILEAALLAESMFPSNVSVARIRNASLAPYRRDPSTAASSSVPKSSIAPSISAIKSAIRAPALNAR